MLVGGDGRVKVLVGEDKDSILDGDLVGGGGGGLLLVGEDDGEEETGDKEEFHHLDRRLDAVRVAFFSRFVM